jgi:hypothetical protein
MESTPYVFKRGSDLDNQSEEDEIIEIDTLMEFNKLAQGNEYIKYQVRIHTYIHIYIHIYIHT